MIYAILSHGSLTLESEEASITSSGKAPKHTVKCFASSNASDENIDRPME
jgi:hypothetical protein